MWKFEYIKVFSFVQIFEYSEYSSPYLVLMAYTLYHSYDVNFYFLKLIFDRLIVQYSLLYLIEYILYFRYIYFSTNI